MISILKAKKLLSNECMRFLASIVNSSKETEFKLDDIPVLRDYVSIFLKNLHRLPSDWEIIFSIELVPRTALIS